MWRKYHRIVSLIVVLPFALVLLTGILLQLRQQFDVIQPKAVKMEKVEGQAILSLDEMVKASGETPANIDQVVWRPGKFHLAMRLKDGREIQMHPQTGEILKNAKRYTNILIDLHQGTFFTQWGQYGIFFPAALGMLFLTISGLVIYPWRKKRV
jgi:uncharacterized iron-regulated membrane protein